MMTSIQSPFSVYRRGDPLDTPLIDNHLAIHLLFPRIINAIRWVLPNIYLDWTAGVSNTTKRLLEILFHASLLLGSCHVCQSRRNILIETPGMRSLGMFLRPSSNSYQSVHAVTRRRWMDAIKTRSQLYAKLVALVLATVIAPRLYEELKHRREHQLREQDMHQRSLDIHFRPRTNIEHNQQQPQSQRERQQATIERRARDRKSRLQTLLLDSVLGAADIFIPPLRLFNYLSFLWGASPTPDLGMRLVGWDYATPDYSANSVLESLGQTYQRHANFHYGNRRLMVEEALRTVSAVIPRRASGAAAVVPDARRPSTRGNAAEESGNGQEPVDVDAGRTQRINKRGSWIRKRALSFMGVVEEEKSSDNSKSECFRNLTCVICGAENPTVSYMTSCGHCYCYICLRMAVTDDLYFRCIECGRKFDASERVEYSCSN